MPGGLGRMRSTFWLGLILAGPIALSNTAPGQERAARSQDTAKSSAKTIYYRSRTFRIPVTIPEEARSMVREVRLWVSDDYGSHWKPLGQTTPDRPEFPFRASRDGEFWFAIQTVDLDGKVYPSDDRQVEPSLRVVIDCPGTGQPQGEPGDGALGTAGRESGTQDVRVRVSVCRIWAE